MVSGAGAICGGGAFLQARLKIYEQVPGPERPEVANTLNGLARVYCNQGRYAEAEPYFKRSLRIQEKALGPEHPD